MGHTYANLLVHVVFSTKHRQPIIDATWRARLYEYMAGIAREEFGKALRIGGTADHVHGLISMRADVSVADAMRVWKSLSSGWLHKTIPGAESFAWQTGYGGFSVSQSAADRVIDYIDHQEAHHRRQSFEDELIALLQRHGIAYDPRYVFD